VKEFGQLVLQKEGDGIPLDRDVANDVVPIFSCFLK
jgi:hypothetical protein